MTKKDIIYIFAIALTITISVFTILHFQNSLSVLQEKNISLKNENTKIRNELETANNELEKMMARQKDTHLIYTLLRKSTFNQDLYNSSLISLAILLNDKEICNEISGTDSELCKDIFENRCDKYEYSNREICANLNTMIDRKVTPDELIANCNNKDMIEDDLAQIHCFQHFAKITNNIRLCDEICKNPISNTNCRAYGRDKNNELKPNKEIEIQACKDYVLGNR